MIGIFIPAFNKSLDNTVASIKNDMSTSQIAYDDNEALTPQKARLLSVNKSVMWDESFDKLSTIYESPKKMC